MAAQSLQLPAGSARTELVALPLSGGWCGLTRVRISTHTTSATLHEWLLIWPNAPGNKTWYRRTGLPANNWYNMSLAPDTEQLRWLAQNESLMKLTYTSTNPISVVFETTRSVLPAPRDTAGLSQWNKTSTSPVANLWTPAATGNNLALNNSTERRAGNVNENNGVAYWKPTT